MLETIVPKSENDSIMVVLGEQRGQVRHYHPTCSMEPPICIISNTIFSINLFRLAESYNGTRTSAERWCSLTDMRRKSSLWTMTVFVTMLEQGTPDPFIV